MDQQLVIQQILNGLQTDLQGEYAAAIQYLQHASMLQGAEYAQVVNELIAHANAEFKHAQILNPLIVYLGGIPTLEVGHKETSMNNEEMLKQDLRGEYGAINRYLTRIHQLESIGLYDSAQKIRNIVVEEQNHVIDLKTALGISHK